MSFYPQVLADPHGPRPNPETGKYDVVARGVSSTLDSASYQTVNEGGFFVFGERRLQPGEPLQSLYQLTGLKEYQITRRHPLTILTSFHSSKEELAQMERSGYVYQKEKAVSLEIIDILGEVLRTQFWSEYSFMEFERGNFSYSRIKDDQPVDVASAFKQNYKELKQTLTEYGQSLIRAGAAQEDVNSFQDEMLASYRQKVEKLQQSARDLLKTYDEVSQKIEADELDNEGAMAELGIVAKQNSAGYEEFLNTKYPLAAQFAIGSEAKMQRVEEVVNQLASQEIVFE